jgi:2-oxoacid:acceptor oxidoreductase delta subunit (pyruvate/2-ketoisovalerate family)
MNEYNDLPDPVLPLGRPIIQSAGPTGTWRPNQKPVLTNEKCSKCGTCVVTCPEGAIEVAIDQGKLADFPTIDLLVCKGCGVCVHECPQEAIEMVPE